MHVSCHSCLMNIFNPVGVIMWVWSVVKDIFQFPGSVPAILCGDVYDYFLVSRIYGVYEF